MTFDALFTTAGTGRLLAFTTSFGDLATPGAGAVYLLADGSTLDSTTYSVSMWNAYNAVNEVEVRAPLFHLLNGDLAYADKETISSTGLTAPGSSGVQPAPEVWRDFFLNLQQSAANRPAPDAVHRQPRGRAGQRRPTATTRTTPGSPSRAMARRRLKSSFYSFRVGSVLFISLDANDVCYQGSGAYNVGGIATTDAAGYPIAKTAHQYNQFYTGTFTQNVRTAPFSPGGAAPNAQTMWLETTLAAARAGTSIDWIVVQMHQCALSSSTDNGCDAGIRQAWVPLFDKYQVDLVVNGHDHDYDRSYPVRGFSATNQGTSTFAGGTVVPRPSGTVTLPSTKGNAVNTFTPNVVTSDGSSPFDTSKGTVYMVLGGGGTNKQDNAYGTDVANVTTFTQTRTGTKPLSDATEPAAWSAMTNSTDAYGVAYFEVDPGQPGGNTTITVTYYNAPAQTNTSTDLPAGKYTVYESFSLTRPRSDNPPAALPEFPVPAFAIGGALALGAGSFADRAAPPVLAAAH